MAGLFAWEPNLCKKYYKQTHKKSPICVFSTGLSICSKQNAHRHIWEKILHNNSKLQWTLFFFKNAVFITIKLWWNNHPPWSADGNYQQLPEIISATHANTQKTNLALWFRDSYRIAAAPKNVKIYSHVRVLHFFLEGTFLFIYLVYFYVKSAFIMILLTHLKRVIFTEGNFTLLWNFSRNQSAHCQTLKL